MWWVIVGVYVSIYYEVLSIKMTYSFKLSSSEYGEFGGITNVKYLNVEVYILGNLDKFILLNDSIIELISLIKLSFYASFNYDNKSIVRYKNAKWYLFSLIKYVAGGVIRTFFQAIFFPIVLYYTRVFTQFFFCA